MKVLIDKIGGLERIDQRIVGRVMRYYYIPRDERALFHLVSRCGILEHLVGRVVDAAVGWGIGWHGKCHPAHVGLQLMKVTLFRELEGKGYHTTLSALIAESRSLPRRRPPRRAKWAKAYGFEEEK